MSHKQSIQKRRRRRRNEVWEERKFQELLSVLKVMEDMMLQMIETMKKGFEIRLKGIASAWRRLDA